MFLLSLFLTYTRFYLQFQFRLRVPTHARLALDETEYKNRKEENGFNSKEGLLPRSSSVGLSQECF